MQKVFIKQIKCGISNCYLLTGDGGSVLIDACGRSDASAIYDKIKNYKVRLILLTHGHPDHTGAAAELSRRLHAPIAISKEDAALLENPTVRQLQAHTLIGKLLKLATKSIMGKGKGAELSPDIWLRDGQSLAEYGINAKVVALSGHTQGSAGILTDDGNFFAGDAVFNILRPSGSLVYENRTRMEQSLGVILRTGAKMLYPGHGKPFPIEKLTHPGDGRL